MACQAAEIFWRRSPTHLHSHEKKAMNSLWCRNWARITIIFDETCFQRLFVFFLKNRLLLLSRIGLLFCEKSHKIFSPLAFVCQEQIYKSANSFFKIDFAKIFMKRFEDPSHLYLLLMRQLSCHFSQHVFLSWHLKDH